MKNFYIKLKKALKYIAASWEGDDGKFSYKRASQFVFIFLIVFLVIKGNIQTQFGFYAMVSLCITFLLLAGIITAQQILSCFQEINKLKKPNE